MKKQRLAATGLAVVMAMVTGNALAAEGRPYVGVATGVAILEDSTLSDSTGSVNISYNPGFVLNGTGGYEFGNGLRVEGEVNFRRAEMDRVSVGNLGAALNSTAWSIGMMANGYYDFRNSSAVTPYLGAGIGFINVNVDEGSINGIRVWTKADDTVFAYQVAVGAALDMSKQAALDIGYRYFGTDDPRFGAVKGTYASHNIMLGLRYRF